MTDLCPSCREPLNYPSGDGCAAMTMHYPSGDGCAAPDGGGGMTEDYHVCPRCLGVGIIEIVWQSVSPAAADAAECPMCDAEGYVPRAQAERYDQGRKLRQARVAAGRSLREAADERGISLKEMADIEWGRA